MKPPASETFPQSIWLDTDIGDDTDDIFALALICASPELKLAGISTVFGETRKRARLAQTLLAMAGGAAKRAPVAAGCGHPLPGKAAPDLLPNGPMRRAPIAQLPCAWPVSKLPSLARQDGVSLLARHLRAHPRETIPIAIGPLTNLAALLLHEPAIRQTIPRMVVMAGEFKKSMWEWNVRCDPQAAACVFSSGIPLISSLGTSA